MTSSFTPIDAIDATFNRSSGTTSILFLIEDSSYMVPLWQRLARSYIPRFLTAIKDANPHASMEALWMITSQETPFKPPFDPPTCQTPRCDNIPLINFSAHGENPVSPTNVTYAIEALSATFGREPATRNLVIVAALNPSADVLGSHGPPGWSTTVKQLDQEEIRVHLIVQSQSMMNGLMPLYWELIGRGRAHQSFASDGQFAFHLSNFYGSTLADKGKGLAVDGRVPNSGLQSTTPNDPSASFMCKPILVCQLRKMTGMERKRCSVIRRNQPAANKPGRSYQKGHPRTRTNASTAWSTPPGPPGHSSPRYKDVSCVLIPPQASTPTPVPPFDHFQYMAPTSQSTPDPPSPPSPGYHESQSYSHEFLGDSRIQHSQAIHVDGSRLAATQFNDIYHNCSYWNEYDRQQGQIQSLEYPRSLGSYPPNSLTLRLVHQPEQTTTTSPLPPMLHDLGTPVIENPCSSYLYLGYEDHSVDASSQNVCLLTDCPPDLDSPTTPMYYS